MELILSPSLYAGRLMKDSHATVAVDVLRATTAMCAAFGAGAAEVVPLDSMEPLPGYLARGYQVACERNGLKMPGATLGNSPTEYRASHLEDVRIAYSTTNGTVSLMAARESDWLAAGCFANISVLTRRLAEMGKDIVVLCSGWKGDPSIEDTLFGGALMDRLLPAGFHPLNDSATMALDLWQTAKNNLYDYCLKATHVQRLLRLGCEADIRFSLQEDTCPMVPVFDRERGSLHL